MHLTVFWPLSFLIFLLRKSYIHGTLFFSSFTIFFVFDFCQLGYDVSSCRWLWIYPFWRFLRLFNVSSNICYRIWEAFEHSSNIFSASFYLGTLSMHIGIFVGLCSFIFINSHLLLWIISVELSSCLLIFSSASVEPLWWIYHFVTAFSNAQFHMVNFYNFYLFHGIFCFLTHCWHTLFPYRFL